MLEWQGEECPLSAYPNKWFFYWLCLPSQYQQQEVLSETEILCYKEPIRNDDCSILKQMIQTELNIILP